MNKPTKHWSATLTALALTLTAPAFGQESTGDPFLDAMMMDQQAAQENTTTAAKTQASAFDEAVARKQAAAKKAAAEAGKPVETKLVSAASDTDLLDDAAVTRELGPATGLFQDGASYDGKRVSGVEFKYTGKKVLPDSADIATLGSTTGINSFHGVPGRPCPEGTPIDFIFVTDDAVKVLVHCIADDETSLAISDHCPLFVDAKFI